MASQAVFGCLSYVLFLRAHFVGGCPTPDTVQVQQYLGPYVEIRILYFFNKMLIIYYNLLVFYGYPLNMAPNTAVFGTIFGFVLKTHHMMPQKQILG